ncbi:uncharacterized protein LAESUDRAFT_764888 [Laetiporus sulphureus 93-53]|uniref:Uncharacterized protein n=1 Tax=Laetiporus sulphureus 93-53 TaxID=1314785 RepID=A0A165B2N7_9APHY|nr:uncharacterized protein LAESUDRAFT_764888 [Laetiporus sulphureus 93-53]KZT00111.1 hypothetical protein LAESUDRAFT_764888 [Laetiporus sulphureus 93-53]
MPPRARRAATFTNVRSIGKLERFSRRCSSNEPCKALQVSQPNDDRAHAAKTAPQCFLAVLTVDHSVDHSAVSASLKMTAHRASRSPETLDWIREQYALYAASHSESLDTTTARRSQLQSPNEHTMPAASVDIVCADATFLRSQSQVWAATQAEHDGGALSGQYARESREFKPSVTAAEECTGPGFPESPIPYTQECDGSAFVDVVRTDATCALSQFS